MGIVEEKHCEELVSSTNGFDYKNAVKKIFVPSWDCKRKREKSSGMSAISDC